MIILTRDDESPLAYRAPVVSKDSNFDFSTALFHVTRVLCTGSSHKRQFGMMFIDWNFRYK